MEGGSLHLPGIINPGSVHHSLLERRDLWRREAEARQHSQPDPAMPPGHTRMPENQRLETLSSLLQSEYAGKGSWLGNPPGTVHPCPALNYSWDPCRPEPAAARAGAAACGGGFTEGPEPPC